MSRIALFVEGETERVFAIRYATEIIGYHDVSLTVENLSGHVYSEVYATSQDEARHYVLIVDCGSDGRVLSSIVERYGGLTQSGFTCIIGLRDLFPVRREELSEVEAAIAANLPSGGAATHIVIAVMEIESWFVQDDQHYSRVDPGLSPALVSAELSMDLSADSAEDLSHPSVDLDRVYRLVGRRYKKKLGETTRTVNALDIENLYLNKGGLLPSFGRFAAIFDLCLSDACA
jgi:hypothetical protein